MTDGSAGPLIFLVAGEPSGDALGGRLMAGLKELTGGRVRFVGVGGEAMAAEGLASLFPMTELSVMGLAEVLPHLPRLLRRIRQTAEEALRLRPVAVVTIDAPDFSFRVHRRLQSSGIKRIHYVAPSVWAWKPGRARKVARLLDHLLALLPFEPPYFEREGLACTFVGHSVIESGADRGDGPAFRARHAIAADTPLLCMLPGSRTGEATRLLPIYGEVVERLAASHARLHLVAPSVPHLAPMIERVTAAWPVPVLVARGGQEKYDAFAAADAALAASGTVALELAMAGAPTVIAYKMNPLTGWLARRLVKIPYANLVNIVLGREAVPELLLEDCTPDRLVPAVRRLLDEPDARTAQRIAAAEALRAMGLGGRAPSRRAARVVLDVIGEAGGADGG